MNFNNKLSRQPCEIIDIIVIDTMTMPEAAI